MQSRKNLGPILKTGFFYFHFAGLLQVSRRFAEDQLADKATFEFSF
jgi:hypothetical protein